MVATINVFNKEKAEELMKLGFHFTVQRVSDDKQVYVFINSSQLMKIVTEKFSERDFYLGKTLNF